MSKISVIIPCRNEADYIAKCLDSIVNCSFPKNELDVFVCDGISSDKTPEIIQSFEKKYSYIKLIHNKFKTTPYALNIGIKESNSEYVTILGAHAEIGKNYLEKSINAFNNNDKIACTGGILNNKYHDDISEAIGNALSSSFGVGNAYFRTGKSSGYVDTVAFGTYKKKIFDEIGFFDEDLARNQDDEFNFKIVHNGYKIFLDKDIKANYYVRANFYQLWKQFWQYGYWKVFVNVKHRKITTIRQIIPFMFIIINLTGLIFSLFNSIYLIIYLVFLLVYLFTGIVSSITKSKTVKTFLLTLFSFIIIHFSYGFGYFSGIIKFVLLKSKPGYKSKLLTR